MDNPENIRDKIGVTQRRRSKTKARLIIIIVCAAGFAAVCVCLLYFLAVPSLIKTTLEREGLFGGSLSLKCERVGFSLFPTSIRLDKLSLISAAAPPNSPPLFRADAATTCFSLTELKKRRLKLAISVEKPVLHLIHDNNKVWNVPLRKHKKAAASAPGDKGRSKKKPLKVESASISISNGTIEIIDELLDGAVLSGTNVECRIRYARDSFAIEHLKADFSGGSIHMVDSGVYFTSDRSWARLAVKGASIKPGKELRPFLYRILPKTMLKGEIDFHTELKLIFSPAQTKHLKIRSITGNGTWKASLGVLLGPEMPPHIASLMPGLSISNFNFYNMQGEFLSFGDETAAEMDILDKNIALHIRGSNNIDGSMKYLLFLDLKRAIEEKARREMEQSGMSALSDDNAKTGVTTILDEDYGRLHLLTFQAMMDKGVKLKNESFTFATGEMIMQFIGANFGSFSNYLSELKSLRRKR